jgi:ADP-ribose pyrophosphatase YjhB (NUDIX family)
MTGAHLTEESVWEGRILRVTWKEGGTLPSRERITQASGVCFTDTGAIVLVGDGSGRWALPGGHPEPGESAEEAFIREVAEEACAVVGQCAYLGAQKVEDPNEPAPYYQTRWWARVHLLPFHPEYETTERKLVPPDEFVAALNWDTSRIAQAVLEASLAVNTEHN